MPLIGKLGTVIGTGVASSASFQMVNFTSNVIRGKMRGDIPNNQTYNVYVEDVKFSTSNSTDTETLINLTQLENTNQLKEKEKIITQIRI